jgi:hemoglobin
MNLLYERVGGHEGISKLLRHFYADVRQDPLIGPIFNAKIKDWKHHLGIITSFWETLTGGPRTYGRPMPMKHLPLQLKEEHFERWLFLWQANCRAQLPIEAAREMIDLAHHIAHKLRIILSVSNDSAVSFDQRMVSGLHTIINESGVDDDDVRTEDFSGY